jgi:hypothetical protein
VKLADDGPRRIASLWTWSAGTRRRIEWLSPDIGRQMIHTETMTLARVTLRRGALVPMHDHVNEQIAPFYWDAFALPSVARSAR